MGAEGGSDQVSENQKERGFVSKTIDNITYALNLNRIINAKNDEGDVAKRSDAQKTHNPDWIETTSLKILDSGIQLSELVRDLSHIPDISTVRDSYYLAKAYLKSEALKLNEYWDVLKPKRD
jgi:hypothetical protein